MAALAELAAEMWERDDLGQPDPTRAEMEDLTPAQVQSYLSPVESTIGAQASGLCEEEIFHRDGRQAVFSLGWGNFCAHTNRRPFLCLDVQLSAAGGRWVTRSALAEVPCHVD